MNQPYVKQFNENWQLINPIKGVYQHQFDNRSTRRKDMQKDKFYGESKNHHLSVTDTAKYKRHKQTIMCKDQETGIPTGEIRVIEHYLSK